MKIIFFSTGKLGIPSLKKLTSSKHELLAVVTQPDKPQGRGWSVQPTPVKAFIEKAAPAIEIAEPENINDPAFVNYLKDKGADIFIVIDYGRILKKEVLDIPSKYCLNLHPSLLPKYRGAAPVNWAILNGDRETGDTIIKMNEGMDSGDIVIQESLEIKPDETAEGLFDRLSQKGGDLLLKVLDDIQEGKETLTPQDQTQATYAPKLAKKDGEIDWSLSAVDISRRIRALQPWPGAYTYLEGKVLKVQEVEVVDIGEGEAPGTIIDEENLVVSTGSNALQIKRLQLQGKKSMPKEEFLRGHRLKKGTSLKKA